MPSYCFKCSKKATESDKNVLKCSTCRIFYHASCVDISPVDSEFMRESKGKWSCPPCLSSKRLLRSNSQSDQPVTLEHFSLLMSKMSSVSEDIKSIKSDQSLILAELRECKTTLDEHTSQLSSHSSIIDECQNKLSQIESSQNAVVSRVDEMTYDIVKIKSTLSAAPDRLPSLCSLDSAEILERVKRSYNILLKNVPESDPEEGDTDVAVKILESIDNSIQSAIVKISRIGKRNPSHPRLLRVSFSNNGVVGTLLRNKKKLLNSGDFKRVLVSDDKTPHQLATLSQLRLDLKERETSGERDLTIKYVRGEPTIVSQTPEN